MPVKPATPRDNSGTIQAAAKRADLEVAEAAIQADGARRMRWRPRARRGRNRARKGVASRLAVASAAALSSKAASLRQSQASACGERHHQRALHRIGEVNARAPHPRRREGRLDLFPAGAALFEHDHSAVKFVESANACQTPLPSVAKADRDQRGDGGGRSCRCCAIVRRQGARAESERRIAACRRGTRSAAREIRAADQASAARRRAAPRSEIRSGHGRY